MSENKNKEKYQRSFNRLHLSDDFRGRLDERLDQEGKGKIKMFNNTVHGISKIAAAIAISVITLGSAGICYACDLGGIRTNLELWINGTKEAIEVEDIGDGAYKLTSDSGAEIHVKGINIDEDGNSTDMDAAELVERTNKQASLEVYPDGRVTFIYKNISADVTDYVDKNGDLYVHVDDPANAETYFHMSAIDRSGYEAMSDVKPLPGVDYVELGFVDASLDAGYESYDSEDIETVTTVTGD